MNIYWQYLVYVIRHKWFVFLASCRLGVWWLGVVHDWSKLRLGEFIPYARHFYGPKRKEWRDSTGYYKPTQTGDLAFDFAWLLHQKRNKHHWQWWICPQDDGGFQVFEMPERYRREMLADWIGAGLAQGKPDTGAWYAKNKGKMILGPETRAWIEQRITPSGGAE